MSATLLAADIPVMQAHDNSQSISSMIWRLFHELWRTFSTLGVTLVAIIIVTIIFEMVFRWLVLGQRPWFLRRTVTSRPSTAEIRKNASERLELLDQRSKLEKEISSRVFQADDVVARARIASFFLKGNAKADAETLISKFDTAVSEAYDKFMKLPAAPDGNGSQAIGYVRQNQNYATTLRTVTDLQAQLRKLSTWCDQREALLGQPKV
jgi:hypothetical protein